MAAAFLLLTKRTTVEANASCGLPHCGYAFVCCGILTFTGKETRPRIYGRFRCVLFMGPHGRDPTSSSPDPKPLVLVSPRLQLLPFQLKALIAHEGKGRGRGKSRPEHAQSPWHAVREVLQATASSKTSWTSLTTAQTQGFKEWTCLAANVFVLGGVPKGHLPARLGCGHRCACSSLEASEATQRAVGMGSRARDGTWKQLEGCEGREELESLPAPPQLALPRVSATRLQPANRSPKPSQGRVEAHDVWLDLHAPGLSVRHRRKECMHVPLSSVHALKLQQDASPLTIFDGAR